jgi:hypothetical protein
MKRQLMVEYGAIKSHLTEKYPECDESYGLQLLKKKLAESEEAEQ